MHECECKVNEFNNRRGPRRRRECGGVQLSMCTPVCERGW